MEQQQYTAFISYRHLSPDDGIAKALHTAIETYHVPVNLRSKTGKKRLGRVFRDQEELPLSSNLGEDIEKALDDSDWFIAVCSPRYLQSQWCLRELEYFMERKGRDRVMAVLIEGEPEQSFPEALRLLTEEMLGLMRALMGESEGVFCAGCAGGADVVCEMPVKKKSRQGQTACGKGKK